MPLPVKISKSLNKAENGPLPKISVFTVLEKTYYENVKLHCVCLKRYSYIIVTDFSNLINIHSESVAEAIQAQNQY